MVPINAPERRQRIDSLRQSVDLSVRDLLQREDMPLPLAVYLWCVHRHHVAIVNGSILAQWGTTWVRRILIEQDIGVRKDEDVSAAALAAVVLQGSPELVEMEEELRAALTRIFSAELKRSSVPFRRPAYATLLLLAAAAYRVEDSRVEQVVHETAQDVIRAIPSGRLFGVGFLMELLCNIGDNVDRSNLRAALFAVVNSTSTQYEDQVYALHALWLDRERDAHLSEQPEMILAIVEKGLDRSPIWPFVMAGDESVAPAGGIDDGVPLSPLFRAILLDLMLGVQEKRGAIAEARLDATYRGDRLVVASAYVIWSLGLLALPVMDIWLVGSQLAPMYRYFILHEYDGMQSAAVLLFTLAIALLGYLAPFAVVAIVRLWRLMMVRAVQSDRRAGELIRESAADVFKLWRNIGLGIIALGLLVSFLYPAFAHMLGSK